MCVRLVITSLQYTIIWFLVLTVVVLILIPVFLFCAVLVMVIFCSYKFWKLFVSAFISRICVSRKIVLLP